MKKSIWFLISLILIFSIMGCSGKFKPSTTPKKVSDKISTNTAIKTGISFQYAFSGFVDMKSTIYDYPAGTIIFSTDSEWTAFKGKYLSYSIPYSGYNVDPIDFTKQSVIYYSIISAKPDSYAIAYQIDNIQIQSKKLIINTKFFENNFNIMIANLNNIYHRFVIAVTVDKKDLTDNLTPPDVIMP